MTRSSQGIEPPPDPERFNLDRPDVRQHRLGPGAVTGVAAVLARLNGLRLLRDQAWQRAAAEGAR
ncbi:hypothetical protein [Streptomyces umbrinus]|uniref:hypothetical protein n=1 Tax=Streptomyces umbrinus TaxID=67370 RepID=UPI003C2F5FBC